MQRMKLFGIVMSSLACWGVASTAMAWDPNAGAEPVAAYVKPQSALVTTPLRAPASYQPVAAAISPQATVPLYAPRPVALPAPVALAPAPQVVAAPVIVAVPDTPAMPAYTRAPIEAAPVAPQESYAPVPVAREPVMRPTPQVARTQASLGVEAFYDNYQEPSTFPSLHNDAYYGSITGSLSHDVAQQMFVEWDGRVSRGTNHYSSDSGVIKNVPQWELESRLLGGYRFPLAEGASLKPYAGIGTRYFFDAGDGKVTNLGALAYDREILQVYAPIGVTYEFLSEGLTIAPTFEIDPLLYGYVRSAFGSFANSEDAENRQNTGFGWRAELLVGKRHKNGSGWEFGPFVRYWDIQDSNTDHFKLNGVPNIGGEPHNKRLQLGTTVKYLF